MLLAYINQAAALYHIPSLGQQVDIMITYLGCKSLKQTSLYIALRPLTVRS